MKAAVLRAFGSPLVVEDVPDPAIGTGEVVVDVAAAPILSYAAEVFSGERRYLLPTLIVPGCGAIGRVRATGPDATKLKPGDWVFCDPTVRSRDDVRMPDITLQGWSARDDGGKRSQGYFRDVPLPSGSAYRPRMPSRSAPSTRQRPAGGARSARC